jgi:hypothetical protein
MQFSFFSSGFRKFLLFALLLIASVGLGLYLRRNWPFPQSPEPVSGRIAGAWAVEKSGSGLAVKWNFDAPLFRNARNVILEIEDGDRQRNIPLDRSERAGTLFYTPQNAGVTLRLRIQGAAKDEPEKTEVIRLGPQTARTPPAAPAARATPMEPPAQQPSESESATQESSRSRLEIPVSIWRVRAFAPPSLTRQLGKDGLEVAVYVKINPAGKVTSASTRKYDQPVEAALANIATDAAMHWKFRPLKGRSNNPIYRDFVIHFKFPQT